MKLCVISLLGAFAISCGGTVGPSARLATAASPSASFGAYRTFSMGLVESGSFKDTTAQSLEEQAVIHDVIVSNLQSKGYVPQARQSTSDIVVRFGSADQEERARETAANPDNHRTVYEGSIQVDVYDSASGLRAWHGAISLPLHKDRVETAALQQSVDELLSSFPSHQPDSAARLSMNR